MKKFFITLFLLLVIFASAFFIFLKLSANGSQYNYFNQNWRYRLGEYALARKILGLHNDGDARLEYLGKKYAKIVVEVDQMAGASRYFTLIDDVQKSLAAKIRAATGKPAVFKFSDSAIPYRESLSAADLEAIKKDYQNYQAAGDEAKLYLLLVFADQENSNRLGVTLEEDGIVLFQKTFGRSFKEADARPDIFPDFLAGTFLHEFGHQLGLDHNAYPFCLMNSYEEFSNQIRPGQVITDFCPAEKELLQKTKNSAISR